MNKSSLFAFAAVASLSFAGCTQGVKATSDPAQIEQSIRAKEAQWQQDYAAKDINALAGQYADDAVIGSPGEKLATTDVERRKMLQPLVDDPNMKVTFASDEVAVADAGDMAYSRGHYSMTLSDKASGKPSTTAGTYLTVYRKQSDGSWKAVEDFLTPGPAPAEIPAK